MAWDEELTMMPIKLTTENESGTANNCGHSAAPGVLALDAKSGALLSRSHDINPT
jgi:hypothetical protein